MLLGEENSHPLAHLLSGTLISSAQHGFVYRKSWTTNLLETYDIITKAIEGGFSVDLAFLDLRKAFDSVPHHRLGIKLEAYGVKGKVLGWCLAFLSDRLQRVLMGEASSD